tara:strand:- start:1740 stop:3581 length:1842 start_codon:yes stop_codon:yes gene_type:complete
MCGIAGYFGRRIIKEKSIEQCYRSINHRGPDGVGIYKKTSNNENIILIHTRLAIIDLDKRSNQPFRVGNKILVFNGEIYNYLEIKSQLQKLGHKFTTSGDTEVLAKALDQWGEKGLEKLEGMWAFALFDENKNELILCRDRFGEKPLYLWNTDGGLYFASEIKAIAKLAGRWPEINENHISRYLINGYKSLYKVSETFYKQIKEVKSSTFIKFSEFKNIEEHHYWKRKSSFTSTQMNYDEAVERVKESLIKALKIRLRADVPVAFCMSGGIDSNSLISIARNILSYDINAFTIKNEDERYEENDLVNYAVKEQEINHTYIDLSKKDFLSNLKKLIEAHDCPIYTLSYYLHWQLMRSISDRGFKVSVSGTGADELFTGYYDHHNFYLAEISNDKELFSISKKNWQKYIGKIVRNPFLKDPEIFIKQPFLRDHIFLNQDMFKSFFYEEWSAEYSEKNFRQTILRNRMENELFEETVPVILHEDDLNSMYYSIENRSPFLDKELYELTSSIPTKYLIKDGKAKSVLRDALRTIAPKKILDNHRKVGFNAPIMHLLDIHDNEVKEKLLDNTSIFRILRKDKLENLLNQENLPNSISRFLFRIINSKIFMESLSEKTI